MSVRLLFVVAGIAVAFAVAVVLVAMSMAGRREDQ